MLTGIEDAAADMVIDTRFEAAAVIVSAAFEVFEFDCAVMVTVPDADAVATPAAFTLAIFESDELQTAELVTSCEVPSEKCAVARNCCCAPMPMDMELGDTWTELTVGTPFEPPEFDAPPLHAVHAQSATKVASTDRVLITSPISN